MKIGINYSAIAFNMKAEKIKYKVFLFCLRTRCCRSRLTKGGSSSRLRPTISRLRSRPKSGGSKKRLRHRNTDKNRTNNYSPTKIRKYVDQKDYSATKLNKKIGRKKFLHHIIWNYEKNDSATPFTMELGKK